MTTIYHEKKEDKATCDEETEQKVEMLEVSLVRKQTTLTDFSFCLAGPPTESFRTQKHHQRKDKRDQKKAQNTRVHSVIDRQGLGGE